MWWLRARHTSHCTQDYKEPACIFWSEKNQASPSIDFLYFHALLACWMVVSSLQWLHLDSSLTELFCSGLAKACPCGDLRGPRDKREAPRSPRTLISYIQAISHRPTILKQQKKETDAACHWIRRSTWSHCQIVVSGRIMTDFANNLLYYFDQLLHSRYLIFKAFWI